AGIVVRSRRGRFGRFATRRAEVDRVVVGAYDNALLRLCSARQDGDDVNDIRSVPFPGIVRYFESRAVAVELGENPAAGGADAAGLLVGVRVVAARSEAGESFDGGGN